MIAYGGAELYIMGTKTMGLSTDTNIYNHTHHKHTISTELSIICNIANQNSIPNYMKVWFSGAVVL